MIPLHGIDVLVSDLMTEPRVQLDPNVPCTDKFRAEYNEWLRQFFGEQPAACMMGGDIVMHPSVLAMLKGALP